LQQPTNDNYLVKPVLVPPMVHAPTHISNSILLLADDKMTLLDFMQAIVRMATRLFTVLKLGKRGPSHNAASGYSP